MFNRELDELSESVSAGSSTASSRETAASATADLEQELQGEKDARREERFIFVAFLVSLVDAFIFLNMQSWTGPVVIGLIQLVAFTVYARRSGIDEVAQILDRIGAAVTRHRNSD